MISKLLKDALACRKGDLTLREALMKKRRCLNSQRWGMTLDYLEEGQILMAVRNTGYASCESIVPSIRVVSWRDDEKKFIKAMRLIIRLLVHYGL